MEHRVLGCDPRLCNKCVITPEQKRHNDELTQYLNRYKCLPLGQIFLATCLVKDIVVEWNEDCGMGDMVVDHYRYS